jgi:hypothetical protein
MLDQLDHVAADVAAATIENLFSDIYRKPIFTGADRARADSFCRTVGFELDSTPRDLVLDPHGARSLNPLLGGRHAAPRVLSGRLLRPAERRSNARMKLMASPGRMPLSTSASARCRSEPMSAR